MEKCSASLCRGPSSRGTELTGLLALTPHLTRAFGLSEVVERARLQGIMEITECMKSAAFALEARGSVLTHNKRAAALIGNGLTLKAGRLQAHTYSGDRQLQGLIWRSLHMAEHPDGISKPIHLAMNDLKRMRVQAVTLESRHRYLFRKVAAVLIMNETETDQASKTRLFRQRFDLTAQESKFVSLLLEGRSVRECGRILSIQNNTARQYMKQILAKSGTHRQGQFIALMTRLLHENGL